VPFWARPHAPGLGSDVLDAMVKRVHDAAVVQCDRQHVRAIHCGGKGFRYRSASTDGDPPRLRGRATRRRASRRPRASTPECIALRTF